MRGNVYISIPASDEANALPSGITRYDWNTYTYDDDGAVDTTTLVHPTWAEYGEKYKADFGAPVAWPKMMLNSSCMNLNCLGLILKSVIGCARFGIICTILHVVQRKWSASIHHWQFRCSTLRFRPCAPLTKSSSIVRRHLKGAT